MKLDKAKFFKTEFGVSLEDCISTWDKCLACGDRQGALWCQIQWEVYQMAIYHCYGINYYFTRTDKYVAVVTEDESDWLIKWRRK